MNLTSFNAKLQITNAYRTQYNSFWQWKVEVEKEPNSHILDDEHRDDTCRKLLNILPGWQTWRGAECDYQKVFPVALGNIAHSYSQVRQYSLLDFNKVPIKPLEEIWHELGRVKEQFGTRTAKGDYFIIAICKPLMFLWGQTLPFDSRNRKNIRRDYSLSLTTSIPRSARWEFSEWKAIMGDFQRELCNKPTIISLLQKNASEAFNSNLAIPYGRYLDINYF